VSPAFLGLLLFGAISLGAAAILLLVRDLAGIAGSRSSSAGAAIRLPRMPLAREEQPPRSFIGEFDQWYLRVVQESGSGWSPGVSTLFLLLGAILVGGVVFLATNNLVGGVLGGSLGVFAALGVLTIARARRMRLLQEQLPPALEMLSRAVRAGESLDQAIALVGEKSPEPLAAEFRRVAKQLGMGLSMTAAMRALVYRLRLMDVRIFTTTLAVHRRSGGNLAATLERLSAVIRERLNYRRQMRAATGAGRISAAFIAAVGPVLFVFLFTFYPDYVQGLLVDPIGRSLLVVAAFLEVIGLIWITRLLRVE
jgi:tight adherence protein B